MNYQLLSWLKEKLLGDSELRDNFVLQDFILPLQHVKASLELNDSLTNIYPVWLVPARLVKKLEVRLFKHFSQGCISTLYQKL